MKTPLNINQILEENRRRNDALATEPYDPVVGNRHDPDRRKIYLAAAGTSVYLPSSIFSDPEFALLKTPADYRRLRISHDFEYWAATCVKIRHKVSGQMIPFVLNSPQRRVLAMLEEDRRAGRPLRVVMLKARQWGGSTLVQMYFAWIQIALRRNWNSLICAQQKDTAAAIRGMYEYVIETYPPDYWFEDSPPKFSAWRKTLNTREIAGRGSTVTISSSFGQDSARGLDFSLVHMSEVAFWRSTDNRTPEDFARTICGSVPVTPLSAIIMESTANGVGNYFHSQWLLAEQHKSAYRPIFVPWHEIDIYRTACTDPVSFIKGWTPYEQKLWNDGLTLEMIQWYHNKRCELPTDQAMFAEYPTTATEAFENTGRNVFRSSDIDLMRSKCTKPIDLSSSAIPDHCQGLLDMPAGDGQLSIWALPDLHPHRRRYVIAVDVGGRWRHADYSVIAVFDRMPRCDPSRPPAIVAQWRGHCDHDILADYAERMARIYGNALLVIESNSLESGVDGHAQYVLEELNNRYKNLYVRTRRDVKGGSGQESRVGFHTNRSTKAAAISALIAAVRKGLYCERDTMACNEMADYELKDSGSYGARRGCHDDILMTRAIGVYVISELPPITVDHTLAQMIAHY